MAKQVLYQCKICGLHYRQKKIALRCQNYCQKHQSCSLEITKKSVERNKTSIAIS